MTTPSSSARISLPEYLEANSSIPVATSGASGKTQGTACFCILLPIRARLALLCSKKGTIDVAIEKPWLAATSIKSTSVRDTVPGSVFILASTISSEILPSLSYGIPA